MLATAANRGGQLLKFGGDALLLLFSGDDHARQACATGVEMRQELRRASETMTSVGRLSLSISIGIHSDRFHLFLVGDSHRELVALGPETTKVMECEAEAVAGEVLLSEATAGSLPRGAVRKRADGRLLLRWRKVSVEPAGQLRDRASDAVVAKTLMPALLVRLLDGARPDPAHRLSTIAFLKFSGTDEVLRSNGPDVLAQRLHEMLGVVQREFASEDVALLCVDCDQGGGKIFCSSGVPLSNEDDEGRMLRATSRIIAAETSLPLQVGINRGHVFAAEIGGETRAAFSAMGDTTNTAARICGKTPPGSIYVHPAVLDHARTLYDAEAVGPFLFKGKSKAQGLYRLGEEVGARATTESDELAFVGRVDAVARLRSRVSEVVAGSGAVELVSGLVGSGKSRLVSEALASNMAIDRIAMHAEPYGSASAYRVFRDPLRSLLGIERGAQSDMRATLLSGVQRLVPQHEELLALFGDVMHIDVMPSATVEAIVPRFRPDRTADVIVELLVAIFDRPLVVTVDDAHWIDEASAHLLARLELESKKRPWLIVSVRRDEDKTANGQGIALGPMLPEFVRTIVMASTRAAPLRPHEIDQIVERAGGNPLFAVELTRAMQELGTFDAVPTSLQGAMAAQVDSLDPFSKRVLSYASVLGRSFRRSVLAQVLGAENIRLDPTMLERLGRFLEPDGRARWRFKNGLVRDITYDGLGFCFRKRVHLETAEAIEQTSTGLDADVDALALHFSLAGDAPRSFKYAVVAAERATRAHANADALVQFERALHSARSISDVPATEHLRLWSDFADVRDLVGQLDEALDALRHASRYAEDDLARCEVILRRARILERAGKFPAALNATTRIRTILSDRTGIEASRLRARALSFAATVRQRQERASAAFDIATAAATIAKRSNERSALARSYNVMAWSLTVSGEESGLTYAEQALEMYEELGDLLGQAGILNNLGAFAYFDGRWSDTVDLYARASVAYRRSGSVGDAAMTDTNIGEVLVNQGRLDAAEPLLGDACRLLRSVGLVRDAVWGEMHLGRLLLMRGDLDAAERSLRTTFEQFIDLGSAGSAYETTLHFAECLVRLNRPQDALNALDRAAARVGAEVAIFAGAHSRVAASALFALGRIDEGGERLNSGIEFARERKLAYDLALLLLLAADQDVQFGASQPQRDQRTEAQSLLEGLGVVSASSDRQHPSRSGSGQ
jgi:class 3 adenylate cyclase/tetratricopeptide (TPR) repeat protein